MYITHIEDLFQSFIIRGRFKEDKNYVEHRYEEAKRKLYDNFVDFVEQPHFKDEFLLAGTISDVKKPVMYHNPDEEPDVEVTLRLPIFIKRKTETTFSATKEDFRFE